MNGSLPQPAQTAQASATAGASMSDWRHRASGLPTRTELSVMIAEYGRAAKHGELQAQADASRELGDMLSAIYRRINAAPSRQEV